MGVIIIIVAIIYAVYKISEEKSFDNCKADNVDHSKMLRDTSFVSQKELKKRYKNGYYNKK